jgi:thiol-disulfide isomerase/thioredoxin
MRSIFMAKGVVTAAILIGLGCVVTGAAEFGRGETRGQAAARVETRPAPVKDNVKSAAVKDDVNPSAVESSIADQYKQIVKEFQAEQKKVADAAAQAKDDAERSKIYEKMTPDDTAYSRRMVDLAATNRKDPASRDALVWVLNKMYRADGGTYGDQVARAVRLLVENHADDPDAVRVGLMLNNVFSRNRDALMEGMYANASSRESKGLARMALAQYLERKATLVNSARERKTRLQYRFDAYENGKPIKKTISASNEEEGYRAGLRLLDPEALKREAERLYDEVISDYGDIPYLTTRHRMLEDVLKEPVPTVNNRPMTAEEIKQLKDVLNKKKTLAQVAEEHLDEMHNLAVGKPAPEIDSKDIDGKRLKLSDFRGKVVVLVFWGSWCGPCMREVPHERALAEKYKGRPFTLLGVNCNEKADVAKTTIEAEKMTWPQWYDGEESGGPIAEKFHVRGFPTIFVIDAQGMIRSKNAREDALDKTVEALMKEVESNAPAKSKSG